MRRFGCLFVCLVAGACGTDETSSAGDPQTPPTSGRVAVESWLEARDYNAWTCEPTIHASRDPSPHGFNRICSNELISTNATAANAWPKGSAAVKELYASMTATTPIGYAVYVKTEDSSANGANWYWYERVPLDHEAPHDSDGTVADGKGDSGPALTICVGCHAGAGSDLAHTPTPGGRDQVYTPVH